MTNQARHHALFSLFLLLTNALYGKVIIEERAGHGITLETTPQGAQIYIDGVERGKTPLVISELESGLHTILFTKDAYEDWQEQLNLSRNSMLYVCVDLTPVRGEVRVKLRAEDGGKILKPDEARILVDSLPLRWISDGEELVAQLGEGQKTLTARLFGYSEEKKSLIITRGTVHRIEFTLRTAPLQIEKLFLNRTVFNPKNAGNLGLLTMNFSVTAPGYGRFRVFDAAGNLIFEELLNQNDAHGAQVPWSDWSQRARWNGTIFDGSSAAAGLYRLCVEASQEPFRTGQAGKAFISEERWVELDYTAEIVPLTLDRLRPGLEYAEYSHVLPQGSFQISTALSAGGFVGKAPKVFYGLPFTTAFRLTPLESFETTFTVHITPKFSGSDAISGGGGAALKKEFWRSMGALPGLSAGAAYSWVDGAAFTERGLAAGAALHAALSWDISGGVSLLVSPALLWTGNDGFPRENAPRFEAGAGVLIKRHSFITGISTRSLVGFTGETRGISPFDVGISLFWFPAAAHTVFGAALQCRPEHSTTFLSGTFSLGIIY